MGAVRLPPPEKNRSQIDKIFILYTDGLQLHTEETPYFKIYLL
jgi:hypothetical protein